MTGTSARVFPSEQQPRTLRAAEVCVMRSSQGRDRTGAGRAVLQPPGPATLQTPFEDQAPRETLSPRPRTQSEEPSLPPAPRSPLFACSPTGCTLPTQSRRVVQMQTAFSQGQNQRITVSLGAECWGAPLAAPQGPDLTRGAAASSLSGRRGRAWRRQGRQPGERVSMGRGRREPHGSSSGNHAVRSSVLLTCRPTVWRDQS